MMMRTITPTIVLLLLLVVASLSSFTLAAPHADLVVGATLPGWNKDTPSRWFSGFLDVAGSQKRLHYMLVEAESLVDPTKAPVVLWLNGGPGCSSLEGFFYEHGPLVVADAHKPPNINWDGEQSSAHDHFDRLVENKWAWSKVANMLYLEAPAGVGFSYSPNPNDLKTGDNQTAADNLAALISLYEDKFPELKNNPLYVSGESYGGRYVPTLALKIYESGLLPQMKGFLVGNGVFDREDAADAMVPFAYGHGLLSTPSYKAIMKACSAGGFVNPSAACQESMQVIRKNLVDVNGYDAYRTCYHPPDEASSSSSSSSSAAPNTPPPHPWHIMEGIIVGGDLTTTESSSSGASSFSMHAWMQHVHRVTSRRRAYYAAGLSSTGSVVPCINSELGTKYLNKPDVQKALHVEDSPNQQWEVCGGVHYEEDHVFPSMIAVYHQILSKYDPRILVYNGDVDMVCNYLWAEASVAKFGPPVVEEWRPWVYGKDENVVVGEQLGGYVTTYDRNISFVTIHGAGHMSPQWRPEAAFTMFQSFLDKQPLPTHTTALAPDA